MTEMLTRGGGNSASEQGSLWADEGRGATVANAELRAGLVVLCGAVAGAGNVRAEVRELAERVGGALAADDVVQGWEHLREIGRRLRGTDDGLGWGNKAELAGELRRVARAFRSDGAL
jgi:hypothetical protein